MAAEKNYRDECQWHAAEHKLINVLENNQELTIENVKKASSISPYCSVGNRNLEEPDRKKLKETIRVGEKFKRLKNSLP